MEETLAVQGSLSASLVFLLVVVLQFIPVFLQQLKKGGSWNHERLQLQKEIKELLKEASSLSNPSTFAEASKLRRLAAAKEKELLKGQELHNKEKTLSYDQYLQYLKVFKVVVYLLLILWFWKEPVATVSQELLKPFGNALFWGPTYYLNDYVPVGIIAWLVISSRVSKFVCQKLTKRMKH
ncbi:hypothetical protein Syun_015020 [Stephania yunnanensis]|uniref:Guided entry of tail-anchored proteins factor 1 n=1 Tax=Stephania yunnanensis TaxID=152371 RepID=A0AAP0JML2_9MAGN